MLDVKMIARARFIGIGPQEDEDAMHATWSASSVGLQTRKTNVVADETQRVGLVRDRAFFARIIVARPLAALGPGLGIQLERLACVSFQPELEMPPSYPPRSGERFHLDPVRSAHTSELERLFEVGMLRLSRVDMSGAHMPPFDLYKLLDES
jgi:hypothetical protein